MSAQQDLYIYSRLFKNERAYGRAYTYRSTKTRNCKKSYTLLQEGVYLGKFCNAVLIKCKPLGFKPLISVDQETFSSIHFVNILSLYFSASAYANPLRSSGLQRDHNQHVDLNQSFLVSPKLSKVISIIVLPERDSSEPNDTQNRS